MNKFGQAIKNFFIRIGQSIKTGLITVWTNIKNIPHPGEYAKQSSDSKLAFYFGTGYLTVRKITKRFLQVVFFGVFLALGMGLGFATGIIQDQPVPTIAQMDKQINHPEQSATLYYADNQKIATVKSDVINSLTTKDKISPLIKKAVVATEDETFYEHKGVLPKSLIRAIFSELTGVGTSTGGSTLTQQLVKMQFLTDQTTWKRKIIEMFFATKIEKHFTKEEIITAYLNVVPFGKNNAGQNITGINEASKGIFGKEVKDLTVPEAAFIAGLPQSPSVYTPYNIDGKIKKDITLGLRRKDIVLFRMYRNHDLTKAEYEEAKKYDITQDFLAPTAKKSTKQYDNYLYNLVTNKSAELLADNLIKQEGEDPTEVQKDDAKYQNYLFQASQLIKEKGYHVKTTIRKDFYDIMSKTSENAALGQTYTSSVYDDNLNQTIDVTEKVQNGAVMLDNKTGKVLGFSGGVDFESSQINHAFDTYRSPGSSIKPYLVYAPAIENKLITSKTVLPDFPTNFDKYIPTDYGNSVENRFINADEALRMSYNLPAVNLYNIVRKKTDVKTYMKDLGFKLSNDEYDELGLALGGTKYGFSVAQNAAAFATFNNNGTRSDPYFIEEIVDPSGKTVYKHENQDKKVFSEGTSYIMNKMLHEVTSNGTAVQLDSDLNFKTDKLIGKTGTSNDYRDIWFNGSTPGITISSWMGYDNFYGHSYNLGEDANITNLDLWAQMANSLYKADPEVFGLDEKQKRPDSVKVHKVLKKTGTMPGTITFDNEEIELSGKEVNSYSLLDNAPAAKAEFSLGARRKNYRSFYKYITDGSGNYGQRLYYTGKTIDDSSNLDDLFINNNQTELDNNYYGQVNVLPKENTDSAQVNGNDKEENGAQGGGKDPNDSTNKQPPDTNNQNPPDQQNPQNPNENNGGNSQTPPNNNQQGGTGGETGTGQTTPPTPNTH